MAKLTLVFALILILLGVAGYAETGRYAPTALIPAWFGVVLGILGLIANTERRKRRMVAMHIAALVGLIGFVFPGVRGGADLAAQMRGEVISHPAAMKEELAMAIICLIFLLLCIRSFIAARRERASAV